MEDEETHYSNESFEPFVSDADSMLIFGAPVQFDVITNENELDDFFNGNRDGSAVPTSDDQLIPIESNEHRSTDSRSSTSRAQTSGRVKFRDQEFAVSPVLELEQFGFLSDGDFASLNTATTEVNADSVETNSISVMQHESISADSQSRSQIPEISSDFVEDYAAIRELEDSETEEKPKKKTKRKKKKKKIPTPEEADDNQTDQQTESNNANSAPIIKPECPAGAKRSHAAPRPVPRQLTTIPEKPSDDVRRAQVVSSQASKKPSVLIPPIVSNIAREFKPLSGVELLKKYDLALKQIQAYSKEREHLLARLDNSAIEIELEKFRNLVHEKEHHINILMEEIRSLKNQTKYQSDCLSAIGKDKDFASDETKTLANYVLVLEERVKRLKAHLETSQRRDRITGIENEKIKSRCDKLLKQKNRYKSQLVVAKDKYAQLESKFLENVNNSVYSASIAGLGEETANLLPQYHNAMIAPPHVDSSMEEDDDKLDNEYFESRLHNNQHEGRQSNDQHSDIQDNILGEKSTSSVHTTETGNAKKVSSLYALHAEQADQIKKLQKSLDMQRESFIRQLAHVSAELKQSQTENTNLKMQLASLENNARTQKLAVRQLRDAYEDLAEGQKQLNVVSNAAFAQERRVISSAPASCSRRTRLAPTTQSPNCDADKRDPHNNAHQPSPTPVAAPATIAIDEHQSTGSISQQPQPPLKPQPPTSKAPMKTNSRKIRPQEIAENAGANSYHLQGVVKGSALEDDKPAQSAGRKGRNPNLSLNPAFITAADST